MNVEVINQTTGRILASIMTNHSMSVDDVINLMGWTVGETGEVLVESTGKPVGADYEELELVY